ncbi:hypothetical protein [Heyndrickxia acidicola]|uniref:Uncharacterized protein n=1 Tax=Heyndrickxia acidicola TaxID=209389 RepID=A0ABU6MFS4_9BACI|nr:hypothetical protein [Heyndrickxia acidicola]MED1203543.1 hypothetical protein [Heyndrickxia acidicola]
MSLKHFLSEEIEMGYIIALTAVGVVSTILVAGFMVKVVMNKEY